MKFWAQPRFVWAAWVTYGILSSAIQLISTSTLTRDLAFSSDLLQRQWAPIYQLRNPPAYEWLLWFVQLFLGDGIISHLLLRYSIIVLFGILIYHAIRQVRSPAPIAAALSFSLVTFFWFGWDFHQRVTHTLPMLLAGLVAWMLLLQWLVKPTNTKAFLLGVALGIGLVSKYNFAIFIFGVATALLVTPRTRRVFSDPRMLLALLGGSLVCAPLVIGLMAADASLIHVSHNILVHDAGEPHFLRLATGLAQFAGAVPKFLLPWAVLIAVAVWRFRKRDWRESDEIDWRGMLALRVTAATVLICILGIVVIGANSVSNRYLYPVFLVAPIGVAAWLTQKVDSEKFAQLITTFAAIIYGVVLITRIGFFNVHDIPKQLSARHLLPYAALAKKLTSYKLDNATFVTYSRRDAGNLISLLPHARVHSVRIKRLQPPQSRLLPGVDCVALWRDKYRLSSDPPREMVVPKIFSSLIPEGTEFQIEKLDIKWRRPLIGAQRATTWYFLRGPAARPICRANRSASDER